MHVYMYVCMYNVCMYGPHVLIHVADVLCMHVYMYVCMYNVCMYVCIGKLAGQWSDQEPLSPRLATGNSPAGYWSTRPYSCI